MINVLVTGSNGQLGSELRKISKDRDYENWNFCDINSLNLLNLEKITTFLNEINPLIVINCAAYTNVDKAELESNIANIINCSAVDIISKWTYEKNRKLIHISTDYVFDGSIKLPLTENSNTNPINEYGRSKLNGELVCIKNDPSSVIIRTSWLYSSFGNNFVKTIIDLMKKNDSINVVNDQISSPTYANDLAKVIIKIIMNYKTKSGLFHYSNSGEISWFDFANSIKKISGFSTIINPISSSEFLTKAERPNYSLLDKSKIKNMFDITIPKYETSLEKCIKILKNEK